MAEDIVTQLADQSGINAEQARKGLGAVLEFLKNKLPADMFSKVKAAVPGAERMMDSAEGAPETPGGIFGAVAGAVGKLFGGGAAELVTKLAQHGFSAEQLQSFVPNVMEFLKARLPENVSEKIAGLLPAPTAAAK